MRRQLRLLITTVGKTLLGDAAVEGEVTAEPVATPFSVLAGSSITCSTAWPSSTTGCWWERPVLLLGDLEVAMGVDAQAVLTGNWDDAHLAPDAILAA